MSTLLTTREVDLIFRYPAGRTAKLVKAGKINYVTLPDGEIRITQATIDKLLAEATPKPEGVDNAK